ncbi:MAG: winged helix-turn-helix transcriptional regulator [Candidatus Hodarchaeales archaeon]|jgi:DNA-binding HxlR family transcriptional regulator
MLEFQQSPIHYSLELISKKWTINILNELFTGRKRYSDLLEANPSMSSKVLSERLKELYHQGIVDKIVINIMPLKSKYQLTHKGKALNKIFFELAIFSSIYYSEKIFGEKQNTNTDILRFYGKQYLIEEEAIKLQQKKYENDRTI